MNNYTFIERLGFGKFGVVHLAQHKVSGTEVVVKEYRSNSFSSKNVNSKQLKNPILSATLALFVSLLL